MHKPLVAEPSHTLCNDGVTLTGELISSLRETGERGQGRPPPKKYRCMFGGAAGLLWLSVFDPAANFP